MDAMEMGVRGHGEQGRGERTEEKSKEQRRVEEGRWGEVRVRRTANKWGTSKE
jgi:hypothetical protein